MSSRKLDDPILFGFVWCAALFMLVVISTIGIDSLLRTSPKMKYRPKPPSCCGDSICLMEHHHD